MDKFELAALRAEQAKQLEANPLFSKAFDDTRTAIMQTWAGLPTSDTENARDLHRMLKCLDKVKHCIQVHIDTGKIAEKEIQGREKRLFSFKG